MQLLILALFLGLYLHDNLPGMVSPARDGLILLSAVLTPKLILLGVYAWLCRWTRRGLSGPDGFRRFRQLDLAGTAFRVGVLVSYGLDLHLGLLVVIRETLTSWIGWQHPVLLDESLAMLPSVLMFGAAWSVYYPIERRLREAALIRRLDEGLPVQPVWSRWQYIVSQYRYQVLLILLPLLVIIAWMDGVEVMIAHGRIGESSKSWWTAGGCVAVFLFAPVMIRLAWDTVPLPEGEIRSHLQAMCRMHRVRVRELLLWRTYGGMINAAVMGFIGPLRYILITDGLLQQLHAPQVEAVMAHELGHIRKRHMFWLLASALAWMGVVEIAVMMLLWSNGIDVNQLDSLWLGLEPGKPISTAGLGLGAFNETQMTVVASLVAAACVWAWGFGWISRRAERQADSFAVAHLARTRNATTIAWADAMTMIEALQRVADLNHVRADKHSWRHGSIRWRQNYLRTLVGCPVDQLPIDRQMRWINIASLIVLAIGAAGYHWFG